MEKNIYTLQQMNAFVQHAIQNGLPGCYWMTAEVASYSLNKGHAYFNFVQRSEAGASLAEARGLCWSNTWRDLSTKFYTVNGGPLTMGMKVLMLVKPTFHELYGFSYAVYDIDPTYTLGERARRRMEILKRLGEDGVMDCNKELALPTLLQRIAVVSSHTAAGFGDFCHQLIDNKSRLRFCPTLFPSAMQGEKAEEGVLNALAQIMARQDEFDVVVIIRGGGANTDLDCFDSYAMAQAVALFPLPVFTGIGHERDETVLDYVAHTRFKTPTAVAAFLVEHGEQQLAALDVLKERICQRAKDRLNAAQERTRMLSIGLPRAFGMVKQKEEARLGKQLDRIRHDVQMWHERLNYNRERVLNQLRNSAARTMTQQSNRLTQVQQHLNALDPVRVLERGYSMTAADGHLVTRASALKTGDTLVTTFADGCVSSVVMHN